MTEQWHPEYARRSVQSAIEAGERAGGTDLFRCPLRSGQLDRIISTKRERLRILRRAPGKRLIDVDDEIAGPIYGEGLSCHAQRIVVCGAPTRAPRQGAVDLDPGDSAGEYDVCSQDCGMNLVAAVLRNVEFQQR